MQQTVFNHFLRALNGIVMICGIAETQGGLKRRFLLPRLEPAVPTCLRAIRDGV
jgi:hypothetical protein